MASGNETPTHAEDDIDMQGSAEEPAEVEDEMDDAGNNTVPQTEDPADPEDDDDDDRKTTSNPQTQFLEYLKSPIIALNVGSGDEATTVSAHKAILTQSPYFAQHLEKATSGSAFGMPDEELDTVACFLQYQYTGEYFPRRLASIPDGLEPDPSIPAVDATGSQLLKHAKVYTLAQKLGMPELQSLAHSKIHRINSTAVGEIAYARYVYGNTSPEDTTIRKPVAAFWATRSHVLRHEAEKEFREMCLEFPQFGFDVLSLVLDQREKRAGTVREDAHGQSTSTPGRGRKRMRPSINV